MEFSFSSYNIYTGLNVEERNARLTHPEWRAKAREKALQESIPLSDIIHFQEGLHFINKYGEEVDSLHSTMNYLASKGYNSLSQALKPLQQNYLHYITSYKLDRFDLIENKVFYCTKTPDQLRGNMTEAESLDHNYDDIGERSILATHLMDKLTGQDLWTINVHIGFSLLHRKQVSKMLVDFVKDLGSDAKVIIAGDFNSFDEDGGNEQMEILNNSGVLSEFTNNFILPSGEFMPNNSTFFAYPFDCITDQKDIKKLVANSINKQEIEENFIANCRALGGQLDHGLVRNLHKLGDVVLNTTPQFFPGPDNYTEAGVKDYIVKHHHEGPAFISDHQPFTVVLNYYQSYDSEL